MFLKCADLQAAPSGPSHAAYDRSAGARDLLAVFCFVTRAKYINKHNRMCSFIGNVLGPILEASETTHARADFT